MSDRSETKQPADEGRLDRRVRRVVDARELATHSEIADAVRGIEKERRDAMRELMRDFDQSYYYPNLKDMREACGRIGHKWRFSHHGPLGDPWFLCGVCHAHECRPERESAELAAERARGDELRRACADVLGQNPETWPNHGNAPLAIAAALALVVAHRDRLRAAGRALLACPHIAERDTDPDWVDAETEAAVAEMRDALKEGVMDDLRLHAYYYSFAPTGQREVDLILHAVARAGKAFHHTSQWADDEMEGFYEHCEGDTCEQWIQNAANKAAAELATLRARVAELERDAARWQAVSAMMTHEHRGDAVGWTLSLVLPGDDLDAAIDATLTQEDHND